MNQSQATSRRFVVVLGLLTGLVAFTIDISLPAIPPMVRDMATTMPVGQQVVGLFVAHPTQHVMGHGCWSTKMVLTLTIFSIKVQ